MSRNLLRLDSLISIIIQIFIDSQPLKKAFFDELKIHETMLAHTYKVNKEKSFKRQNKVFVHC